MRDSNICQAKRITASIMGLMMLVAVLFSAFYIAAKADHHCTGEDCPICACIQQCENILRGFRGGMTARLSVIAPVILTLLLAAFFVTVLPQETLVSRKVRLNR